MLHADTAKKYFLTLYSTSPCTLYMLKNKNHLYIYGFVIMVCYVCLFYMYLVQTKLADCVENTHTQERKVFLYGFLSKFACYSKNMYRIFYSPNDNNSRAEKKITKHNTNQEHSQKSLFIFIS